MYEYAEGFNNEGSLAPFDPQPASKGIMPGRVVEALDHSEYEDGFQNVELEFSCVTAEQAEDLYTLINFNGARSVQCTISLPLNETSANSVREFGNFNATIKKPIIGKEGKYRYWWENLIFRVVIEEAL